MIMTAMAAGAATVDVDRIDPPNWYTGLNDPSLQLMIYGKGIKGAEVTTNYPGVSSDSVVNVESANYLLVYLNVKDAQPGAMTLNFSHNGKRKAVKYELKARSMSGEQHQGFTAADVLYMLMPDRFADGNPRNDQLAGMQPYTCNRNEPSLRHGGDLKGIEQHLDYFDQLGVTALWFTPVLENNSPDENGTFSTYHGYATTDYYKVDPRFGTNDEYKQLVAQAHQHGLKVVMDMIFNHCGLYHPWLKDLPAKDWLNWPAGYQKYMQTSYKLTPVMDPYASQVDKKETLEGWFVPTMPDLNQNNPHVMTYLIQNSVWWIETVGIDGIRMDTYPYAYKQPMARWMKRLNDEYPNFNVVGETWVTEPAYTAAWQKDSPLSNDNSYLPTVMDFSFYEKLDSAKNEETDGWWKGYNRIYNSFVYDYLYKDPSHVMAFIENHDTDRFLADGKDVNALKQALALLLTVKRIPQLYYGTEVLMNGTKQVTDGNVRKDFMGGFPGDKRNCFTREGRTAQENDMFDWLSAVLHWRQHNDVITKGTMTQFCPYGGVYVVARRYQGKKVMTVLNGTSKAATLSVNRYAEVIEGATTARDVPTGKIVDLTRDYNLAPREALILEF